MGKVVLYSYLQAILRDCTGAPSSHHKAPPSSSFSVPKRVVANRARLPAHGTRNGDILLRSAFAACPEQRHANPCCGSHGRRTFAQLLLLECTTGETMGADAKAMQAMEYSVDIAHTHTPAIPPSCVPLPLPYRPKSSCHYISHVVLGTSCDFFVVTPHSFLVTLRALKRKMRHNYSWWFLFLVS